MLVRQFVGARLAAYYSQRSDAVVGSAMASPISFSSLLGEWHWKRVYQQAYQLQQGHWLTPVEIFRPYYSNSIANFCASCLGNDDGVSDRVEIVEVGGGRGTNAISILNHLKLTRPDVYDKLRYTLVDSSPTLHKLQVETLQRSEHADRCSALRKDLMDIAQGKDGLLSASESKTVVIALEVFDNLPHDKIRVVRNGKVEQAEIVQRPSVNTNSSKYEEIYKPLSDPLLSFVLRTNPQYIQAPSCWVPTVACGLLRHVFQAQPQANMLVADFDWLPPPDGHVASTAEAHGEPLVTSMDGKDHSSYLHAPPLCDILFPTDFDKLSSYAKKICGSSHEIVVSKQGDFLQQHGPEEVKATTSWLTGYNPLIHDFANCSVVTIRSRH
jgi:SAM-dependent MidA family methyltransferase